MTYKIRLGTYSGTVKNLTLPNRQAVENFISTYPENLPVGVSIKMDCDVLGIRGILRGKKERAVQ